MSLEPTDFGLGPQPTWVKCACGVETTFAPCWDCVAREREQKSRADAVDERTRTIPDGYAWATLRAPELAGRVKTRESVQSLAQVILGARNVVFFGPAGAGKTSLAVACLREKISSGGIYVSAVALGSAAIRHKAGTGDAPMVEEACRVPLALIDDIGSESATSVNAVPEVVFRRHERALATWVTTGLTFAALQSRYGDGIARRISEHALIVKLGSTS